MGTRARVLVALVATATMTAALLSGAAAGATAATTITAPVVHPHSPWAHGEHDEVLDNPVDAYGLCRTAKEAGLPFSYPRPRAGEVNTIVGDRPNDSGASNLGCTTAQNESTIAVNPVNPANLIAGANDYRVCCDFSGLNDGTGWAYYSRDGGRTWRNVQLPALTAETGATGALTDVDSAGDPVVTFSPEGVAYYANIVFSRVSPASGVVVSRSLDGGRTWSRPSVVVFDNTAQVFHDKEWIAADSFGRVIVTWTRFDSDADGNYLQSPIVAKESTNFGRTWGPEQAVSDTAHPFNQGSQVGFGLHHELYVAYEGSSPTTEYATDALVLAHSTGKAHEFATAELARVYDDPDCYPVSGGRQVLSGQHFRINSFPSMSVDPRTGQVAITWADDQGAGTCGQGGTTFTGTTSNQVKLVTGRWQHFSTARRITTGAADKVYPAVATLGWHTVTSYYTAGYTSTNPACFVKIPDNATGAAYETSATSVCLDVASRSSRDGFRHERRLTSAGSNPYVQFADGSFIGDYTQIALGIDGVAHASWTDFRGRPGANTPNQDIYVSNFR